ncbi:roadblock/LC7 domain-containing protein [Streptomyces sp. NBC_00820]|uniref:roadblock/LC7 domain-containing protein n=1 Tax=Streptomyces sp. NBC_00820 TaxID=2975842 RepID=UPI002ED6BFB6|nr:roadblock/LC7 domain-containing protein [Streptomyces sp. NBC_00820]
MVPEQDLEAVLDELRRLRTRVPQLTGALAAGVDGLVVAHDTPGVDPEGLAALTAASLGVAVRVADATGNGGFRELLVRGDHGYIATYAAGRTAVLTLLAQDRVNVGRLHLEGRRAGARVGELLDAAESTARAARAERPARTVPARTRTTRTTRTTTTGPEARTATDS